MPLSNTTKRVMVWGPLAVAVLLLAPFLAAYLEWTLLGTARIESVMRWVGIHDAAMQLRDLLAL